MLVVWDVSAPILEYRDAEMTTLHPADVVLLEGILVLYDPQVRELMHIKLFVDTDSDTRLARRGEQYIPHTCALLMLLSVHACSAERYSGNGQRIGPSAQPVY